MRLRLMSAVVTAAAALTVAAAAVPAATAAPIGATEPSGSTAPDGTGGTTDVPTRRACDEKTQPGRMQCMALLRTTADGAPMTAAAEDATLPPGYGPSQLQAAYRLAELAKSGGADKTVAIVDAFDNPNAESDLAVYREQYGLPPCTTDNGCFRKVNQRGDAAPLPEPNAGWALEISLDLDMVSAVCPRCHILLVEGDDNYDRSLAAAVATAAKLGADAISNSYGEPEYPGITALEPFFDQPGVMITAASGDWGYGTSYPGTSANVTAVGGTRLWPSSTNRGWTESTWTGSGSGCSTQIPKPAWQHDQCSHRTGNDVAAVADPSTPVAVYDALWGGWVQLGGTSASAPIVASVFALAGDPAHADPSHFYEHPDKVFDVTSGSDGTCSPAYLCTAGTGYDGPTGMGTPNPTGFVDGGTSCVGGWSPTPEQNPSLSQATANRNTLVYDMAIQALSSSDVWTVGVRSAYNREGLAGMRGLLPHVNHWDGTAWRAVPSPEPVNTTSAFSDTVLRAVSFDRPDDGWAVGTQHAGGGTLGATRTGLLVQHWDGRRWSLSPALQPVHTVVFSNGVSIPADVMATSVAAVAPDDVWVAGTWGDTHDGLDDPPQGGAFLEHWDGVTWTLVALSDEQSQSVLTGLHAVASDDVWAVGYRKGADGADPVALHWDGRAWSDTDVPTDSEANLWAVSGSSTDDVWATGFSVVPGTFDQLPFTAHWDGKQWTVVETKDAESVRTGSTNLLGVTVISPTDAWAVGMYTAYRERVRSHPYLLEHWDGHEWTVVQAPQPASPVGLWAVSASGADDVWATGAEQVDVPGGLFTYSSVVRNGCTR